jgi:hypothetical protein
MSFMFRLLNVWYSLARALSDLRAGLDAVEKSPYIVEEASNIKPENVVYVAR